MSNYNKFCALYEPNLNNANNQYILNNPNIKSSFINFLKYYDYQFYLTIKNESLVQICNNYFKHLDIKESLITQFINSFSETEINKIKDFLNSLSLIGFTDLGYLQNILIWYSFYKKKGLGNIDSFIIDLNYITVFDKLEIKFYGLGFVDNPNVNSEFSVSNYKSFENEESYINSIFFNLFNQSDPKPIVLEKLDYYNLIFLMNIFDSKSMLINYYNDKMDYLSFRPFFKTFETIILKIKNNT